MKSTRSISAIILILALLFVGSMAIAENLEEGTLVLPSSLKVIKEEAFCGNTSIDKVILPEGVTEIQSKAFANSSLSEINLPDSLTYIADDAFDGSVNVSVSVNEGTYAYQWATDNYYFYDSTSPSDFTYDATCCAITGYIGSETALVLPVWTPDGYRVQEISDDAFANQSSLTSVVISDTVTTIGDSAFSGCTNLANIEIPDSVTSIGDGAFYGCEALADADGLVIVRNVLYGYYGTSNAVVVPSSVTVFDGKAFEGRSDLTDLTLPDAVESIEANTLDAIPYLHCTLNSTTARTLSKLGYGFWIDGCEYKYTFAEDGTETALVLVDALAGIETAAIPNSVTSIGAYAFNYCAMLKNITIPNSITSIGLRAFNECDGLESITIPSSITSFGSYAFANCSALTSVTISEGLTSIGNNAFYNCQDLESITIPASVTSIGTNAFYNCQNLTICGASGSEAETYAEKNGIDFRIQE